MTIARDQGPPRQAEGAPAENGTPPELTPPVDDLTTLDFARRLGELLDVPLISRPPNPQQKPEFQFPTGQRNTYTSDKNHAELKNWRRGWAIMGVMGDNVAVVDVDPRNGGDPDRVRQLLDTLHVRVYAEVE